MIHVLLAAGGLLGLLIASEVLVGQISLLGTRLGAPHVWLGVLVALGADAPEITTALAALATGSQSIGVGVVEGSNIYNVAGLLGFGGLLAAAMSIDRQQALVLGAGTTVLCAVAAMAVALSSAGAARAALGATVLLGTAALLVMQPAGASDVEASGSTVRPLLLGALAAIGLVVMSGVLVRNVEDLVTSGHIPLGVVSILVLPIATSIPNTWAAVHLARRGLGQAVLATVFTSNLINVSLGIALPTLVVALKPERAAVAVDAPAMVAMTALATLLLVAYRVVDRRLALIVMTAYAAYLVIRFSLA